MEESRSTAMQHLFGRTFLCFFVIFGLTVFASPAIFSASPKDTCEAAGDTWDTDKGTCKSNVTKTASPQQRTCEGSGGTWNAGAKKCGDNAANGPSLPATVTNAINILLFIIGVAAVIVIVIQGFRFVNSDGDSSQVSKAKNGIIFAIIGLVVAFMAYALVNFILDQL